MDNPNTIDANPYSAPTSHLPGKRRSREWASYPNFAVTGAIWSVVSAFPIAGLMALFFRFPVPFAGYVSGLHAVLPAMVAVVFYGVFMGGLVLVAVLGAVSGAVTAILTGPAVQHQRRAVRTMSFTITAICLFVLAILDKIIGPW